MARGSYGRALQLDRAKETVYLPVFSSQGVVRLKSVADVASKTLVVDAETAIDAVILAEAGEIISAAEVIKTEKPKDITVALSVENELLTAMAEEEGSQSKGTDVPIVAAKLENKVKEEMNNDVAVDLQTESAKSFMLAWAQAWSNQDVDAYLNFYGDQFAPPAGKKRTDWEAQRRTRILAPKEILVTLDDFQVNSLENGRQQIEVIQSYKSNLLADRFKKVFDLQQTDIGWKIIRERSLGRVR